MGEDLQVCCNSAVLRVGMSQFAAGSDQDLPGIAKPAVLTHKDCTVASDTAVQGVGTALVVIRGPAADLSGMLTR